MITFVALVIAIALTVAMVRCAGSDRPRWLQALLVTVVTLSYFVTILLAINAKTQTVGSWRDLTVLLILLGIK